MSYQDDNKTIKSDKVFIVEVNHIKDKYIVSATWGKRTAPRLTSQIKSDHRTRQNDALIEATKLINDKKRGKDKYVNAAKELVIPGFNKGLISSAELHVDSTTVARTATISTVDVPSVRKIRL